MNHFVLCTVLFLLMGVGNIANAQEKPKQFLIITSTLDRPYEVVSAIVMRSLISSSLINGPINGVGDAIDEGRKALEANARKLGGDAVINTSMQVVFYPFQRAGGDQLGQVIFYGTVVKLKPE